MKIRKILVLMGIILMQLSCSSVQPKISDSIVQSKEVGFEEIRRATSETVFPEVTILTSPQETAKVYGIISKDKYSKSAPIPVAQENEVIVMLQPKLKDIPFGDIKIEKIVNNNKVLEVYYSEIENQSYKQQQKKNPILILKINTNTEKIILKKIN